MRFKYKKSAAVMLAMLVAATTAGCSSSGSSTRSSGSSAPQSGTTVKIGMLVSKTGIYQTVFKNAEWGAEARIAAQNAAGGVNGHKLELIEEDTTSTPAGAVTAADLLVQKGATIILDDSGFVFAVYQKLHQEGIPVIGYGQDGPEWETQPYTNMLDVLPELVTPINGTYYSYGGYPGLGEFMKAHDVKKMSWAQISFPSGPLQISNAFASLVTNGISKCYIQDSIPGTTMDFTTIALAIKAQGCDGIQAQITPAQLVALAQALTSAGDTKIVKNFYGLYDPSVQADATAWAALQGVYTGDFANYTTPNAAAKNVIEALTKYTPFRATLVNENTSIAWAEADLAIEGLKLAGANPTSASFISAVRQHIKDFTAGGLFPNPIDYTQFATTGVYPQQRCAYYYQITATGYVPFNSGKPVCGQRVAVKA